MKELIYKWVKENYSESEADNPSWNIDLLAKHIESQLKDKLDRWLDVLNYFDSDIEECAERNNDMRMYKKYEQVQDEMYNLTKGK